MNITNKIGAPVTGNDFFGRTKEIAKATRYLDEKQSLLLSAPRRIGKSSLAKKLIANKVIEGWKCVYIDLQGVASTEDFLRILIDSFTGAGIMQKTQKKVKDFISSVFTVTDNIELGPLKINLAHPLSAETIYNRMSHIFAHQQDCLIVIDELPLFLGKLIGKEGENLKDVEFLLSWFRSIRQLDDSRLRWLFCGSVGLRNFTTHYGISQTINDLVDFKLGEFSQSEAIGLINALAQSYDIRMDEKIIAQTLDMLQWPIPYFIQLLMDRVISAKQNTEDTVVRSEEIKSAFDELIQSDYFMTWDERLEEYRELQPMARTILDTLSNIENGLEKQQLTQILMKDHVSTEEGAVNKKLVKVLSMLEHDGYILRNDGNRKFRSPLLRKWWKHKLL